VNEPDAVVDTAVCVRTKPYCNYLVIALFLLASLLCMKFVDIPFERIDGPLEEVPLVVALSELGRGAGGRIGGTLLALVVIILARKRWKQIGLTLVCGLAVQSAATEIIKHFSGRPRPRQFDDMLMFYGPGSDFHSFPSGHASFAFMLATITAAYYPRARWPAYAGAVIIASGRVMVDAHFLSDVMVGALIGYLAAYLFLRLWPPQQPAIPAPTASSPVTKRVSAHNGSSPARTPRFYAVIRTRLASMLACVLQVVPSVL